MMDESHITARAAAPQKLEDARRIWPRRFRLSLMTLALGTQACGGGSTGPADGGGGTANESTVGLVRQAAIPLTGAATDYDRLMQLVGDARVVTLGESTHGTDEFYRERARITQRLITEKGFSAVAIEGDWPDAFRVNQYVRGIGQDASAEQALSSFTQFPQWMWRNEAVRDLVSWMRTQNNARPVAQRVGFYGLDVYSLHESIDEVLTYLDRVDPASAGRVRGWYACFNASRPDAQSYGAGTRGGTSCQNQAALAVTELTNRANTRPSDPVEAEALFSAVRNANSVANAERYFRTMYQGGASTWNIRDEEMADNLIALEQHLATTTGRQAKVVVWAHNTHVGDARVTQPGEEGEHNIGQLVRQRLGDASVLVGFHTYAGSVFAARAWGEAGFDQPLRPARGDSYAGIFHATGVPNFLLLLRNAGPLAEALSAPSTLQRAVGVVYAPTTELQSHYIRARLGQQFDAVVFFDSSRAVKPLR